MLSEYCSAPGLFSDVVNVPLGQSGNVQILMQRVDDETDAVANLP